MGKSWLRRAFWSFALKIVQNLKDKVNDSVDSNATGTFSSPEIDFLSSFLFLDCSSQGFSVLKESTYDCGSGFLLAS